MFKNCLFLKLDNEAYTSREVNPLTATFKDHEREILVVSIDLAKLSSFILFGPLFIRATNEKYRKKVWYGNEKRQQGMGEGGQVKVMPFSASVLCVRTCLSASHATLRERETGDPPASFEKWP